MTSEAPLGPVAMDTSAGIVAIIGRANVGKSTLLNAVVEEKVAIVSPVAQTTRNMIRAILTEPRGQLVFLDTPGVHKAQTDLNKLMNRMARSALDGADVVLLVLDAATRPRDEDEGWMRRLVKLGCEPLIVFNKCDLSVEHIPAYEAIWHDICTQKQVPETAEKLKVSAATADGVPELLAHLFQRVPLGPPLFPPDILTDFPRKLNIGDVVREKLFMQLKEELPHAIAVSVSRIEEIDGRWDVYADIYVNRPSQKGIVIGHKGRLLKRATIEAERELAEMYGHEVRLNLWVKVEKDWAKNFWILRQLGYA